MAWYKEWIADGGKASHRGLELPLAGATAAQGSPTELAVCASFA
jgi:hypothetical protein